MHTASPVVPLHSVLPCLSNERFTGHLSELRSHAGDAGTRVPGEGGTANHAARKVIRSARLNICTVRAAVANGMRLNTCILSGLSFHETYVYNCSDCSHYMVTFGNG
jgi:hypothetical protein